MTEDQEWRGHLAQAQASLALVKDDQRSVFYAPVAQTHALVALVGVLERIAVALEKLAENKEWIP